MESEVSRDPDTGKNTLTADKMEYREAVRKRLQEEIKNVIDLEMQKAAQELIEEHKKATRQVVEEYRATIHQIVEEEKVEIWKKAETLKRSILRLGL
jgi:predicted Ser/Thr protein kinase